MRIKTALSLLTTAIMTATCLSVVASPARADGADLVTFELASLGCDPGPNGAPVAKFRTFNGDTSTEYHKVHFRYSHPVTGATEWDYMILPGEDFTGWNQMTMRDNTRPSIPGSPWWIELSVDGGPARTINGVWPDCRKPPELVYVNATCNQGIRIGDVGESHAVFALYTYSMGGELVLGLDGPPRQTWTWQLIGTGGYGDPQKIPLRGYYSGQVLQADVTFNGVGIPGSSASFVVPTCADNGPRPIINPAPSPAPPAASSPAPVTVKVKATSRKSKLYVDVNPTAGDGYFTFQVQRARADGTWKPLKTYRTKGYKENRTINLPKGTYHVVVSPAWGWAGATSSNAYLKR